MESIMEDRLMTVKQLAEYLRVNDRTVLKLVKGKDDELIDDVRSAT